MSPVRRGTRTPPFARRLRRDRRPRPPRDRMVRVRPRVRPRGGVRDHRALCRVGLLPRTDECVRSHRHRGDRRAHDAVDRGLSALRGDGPAVHAVSPGVFRRRSHHHGRWLHHRLALPLSLATNAAGAFLATGRHGGGRSRRNWSAQFRSDTCSAGPRSARHSDGQPVSANIGASDTAPLYSPAVHGCESTTDSRITTSNCGSACVAHQHDDQVDDSPVVHPRSANTVATTPTGLRTVLRGPPSAESLPVTSRCGEPLTITGFK